MNRNFAFHTYDIEEKDAVLNACSEGKKLWQWGNREEYKALTKEELIKQLEHFGSQLEFAGKKSNYKFLKLVNDAAENMPGDARVELLYAPTYVAEAVYIYAYTKYPEIFENATYRNWFKELLHASMGRNLMGHGYDATDSLLDTLLLFAKADAKAFLKNAPDYAQDFCSMLNEHYERLQKDVSNCTKRGVPYCIQGFCLVNKDRLAKEILNLIQ